MWRSTIAKVAGGISLLLAANTAQAKAPVVAYFTGDAEEVPAKLAQLCVERGILVVEQDRFHVKCAKEERSFGGLLAHALVNPRYSTSPQMVVQFSISRIAHYSAVQAVQWMESQSAFGQMRRMEIDGRKAQSQLLSALLSAGATSVVPLRPAVAQAPETTAPAQSTVEAITTPGPTMVAGPKLKPQPAATASQPATAEDSFGNRRVRCETCR